MMANGGEWWRMLANGGEWWRTVANDGEPMVNGRSLFEFSSYERPE